MSTVHFELILSSRPEWQAFEKWAQLLYPHHSCLPKYITLSVTSFFFFISVINLPFSALLLIYTYIIFLIKKTKPCSPEPNSLSFSYHFSTFLLNKSSQTSFVCSTYCLHDLTSHLLLNPVQLGFYLLLWENAYTKSPTTSCHQIQWTRDMFSLPLMGYLSHTTY